MTEPHEETIDAFREWVRANAHDDLTVREWWCRLADSGWGFPSWPVGLGGRGLSGDASRAIRRAFVELDLLGPPHGYALTMLAPTVLEHGSDAQRQRFVLPVARGELTACQLFSEPEAGSDLASLRTKATRDGSTWTIDGQKVWNSGAHEADVGMLLARTNPDVPKHRGMTYFLLPMDQPGVDVRPLRQMNAMAEFNETFMAAAVVRDDDRLGDVGNGWKVAQTTLALERSAAPPASKTVPAGERAGWLGRSLREARHDAGAERRRPAMYSRSGWAARALAQRVGRSNDPIIRQEIADLYIRSEIQKLTARRVRTTRIAGGPQILKLQAAELARRARDVDLRILGANGVASDDHRFDDVILMSLSAHIVSIGGGTDQIQKNILGERALGLPREPDTSKKVPFNQVARSDR